MQFVHAVHPCHPCCPTHQRWAMTTKPTRTDKAHNAARPGNGAMPPLGSWDSQVLRRSPAQHEPAPYGSRYGQATGKSRHGVLAAPRSHLTPAAFMRCRSAPASNMRPDCTHQQPSWQRQDNPGPPDNPTQRQAAKTAAIVKLACCVLSCHANH
jgi:hypothetical protein